MAGRSGNQWPGQHVGGYQQGMMQQNQGQQHGWQGQAAGGLPSIPPQQQQFQPPPPRGPAPPPPQANGCNWAPQVSLQPHHWQHQQQQQPRGPIFHPGQHNMAMNQYLQPTMMMHHGHYQHFQQQQQQQHHYVNGMNTNQGVQQMRHGNQQHQHHSRQPNNNSNTNKRNTTSNNNPSSTTASGAVATNNNGNGNEKPGAERPSLALPPSKRRRKKDIVLPVEKMTTEPTVREPINETERVEVEAWKSERRKHWPSVENLARKEQENAARHARGELIDRSGEDSRKTRLQEILQRQRAMGLSKQAGTEEMLLQMNGKGGAEERGREERGRKGHGRDRGNDVKGGLIEYNDRGGRGGKNNSRYSGPEYGYQSFINAGEAPQIDPGLAKWRQRQEGKKDEKEGATNGIDGEVKEIQVIGKVKADGVVIDDENKGIEGVEELKVVENSTPAEGDNLHQQQLPTASRDRGRGRGRGRGSRSRGNRDNNNESRQQQQQQRRPPPLTHAKPSLLEKLLAKEIRQDMSYILQAFRFFVMNNFFGQQQQQQQQVEDSIVFPVAAMEADTALAQTTNTVLDDTPAAATGKKPTTIQDILRNKEGIDIEITDDDDDDEEEQQELLVEDN